MNVRKLCLKLLGLALLPGCGAKPDPAAEAFEKAGSAFDRWELETAIAHSSEAIRLNPRFAETYCYRGGASSEKGESGWTKPRGAFVLLGFTLSLLANVLILLPVQALVLRGICALGSGRTPRFGEALWASFLAGLIWYVGLAAMRGMVHVTASGGDARSVRAFAYLLWIPLAMILSAAIYRHKLAITLGKGILIWLVQFVVYIITAVALGAAIRALMMHLIREFPGL
jgi:hypothetical protein